MLINNRVPNIHFITRLMKWVLKNRTSEKITVRFKLLIYQLWRDCLGIEPSYPGTQDTGGFEDRGGHQYPNQPRMKNRV